MPSPLKCPSPGGRLGRILASLRSPARAGPLPVQTGFPTSLADLVVKNHVRLKNPRRRPRPSATPSSPAPPVFAAEPVPRQSREFSVVQDAAARPKGAAFSIRPELLTVGGAVALALLLVWSKWLVAAATLASVVLYWIDSIRSSASRRRARPEAAELDLCGCGRVSPIREAESEAETPRSSCADSDKVTEVSSLWAADNSDITGGDDSINPKRKEKKRSFRKLIAKKLHNDKRSKDKDSPGSRHGGESKHPDAGEAGVDAGPVKTEPLVTPAEQTTAPEAITDERCRRGGALPLAAFIPIILVGLVAGKLPAVALIVLCAVFFSSIERVPS
ncbi:uncharacterized protein LOC133905036 [Phragmites australis]|uniref:uncharacterized protein LOC133905036 n=1 Tax=Phragmites australis TaxID=29695 RepID=UPI002D793608|nr:uncharacterized protein LOC133905036 [Phragmites australis]